MISKAIRVLVWALVTGFKYFIYNVLLGWDEELPPFPLE